jgi:hypothetical protein
MRATALLASVLFASAPLLATADPGVSSGNKVLSASSAIGFAIRVPRVLQMRFLEHPASVIVTAADILRGEIVVRGPRLDIVANQRSGFLLRAQLLDRAFSGMRLLGLAREVQADSEASVTAFPSMVGEARPEAQGVEYRLRLAPDAAPGRYSWPVSLTIQDP